MISRIGGRVCSLIIHRSQKTYAEREEDYRMDPREKPPFNYAQIIAMAMMDQGRMTLQDICSWIKEHFAYYRYNKKWNVNVALSLFVFHLLISLSRARNIYS